MVYFPNFKNDIKEMSFENVYLNGSMIGGEVTLSPVIHTKSGIINDIGVGFQTYTMYAYEKNRFKQGEKVVDCLARHGININEVEKIVVFIKDTTGEKENHRTCLWTPVNGWKTIEYKEIE